MRILFIGDVVGKSGREKVKELTRQYREEYNVDYVICNAENSAHGKGITKKIYYDLLANGVDFITLGNHAFSKSEFKMEIDNLDKIIRPGNLKDITCGTWYKVVDVDGVKLCIVNLLGRSFIDCADESPFTMMEELLKTVKVDLYFVDFHAETTGEKLAFANNFADRVQTVVGTHTHVQTADERIINNCAYISDVGMCGSYDSILGRDTQETIGLFLNESKSRYTVATGEAQYCAVVIDYDVVKKRAIEIKRIFRIPQL